MTRLGRVAFLEHEIRALEAIAEAHAGESTVSSAVAARKTAAELHAELLRLKAARKRAPAPKTLAAYQGELDAARRRLRLAAEDAESYVAASKLLGEEQAAVDRKVAEEKAAADRRRDQLDLPDVVRALLDVLLALPSDVRSQVASVLSADADVH